MAITRRPPASKRCSGWLILFGLLIAVSWIGSASAEDRFYRFRSVVFTTNDGWCIDIPGANYKSGVKLSTWECRNQPNQVFGFESSSSLMTQWFGPKH